MFRASSAHHQEDRVVYMQHMVLSLWEFLVACRYTACAVYRQATRNSHRDSTICWMYTTVSSWWWALEARNMYRRI